MGKRELIALLNLSSWCLVMVERLFLTVPRGCLQFVIVVFPDHTHLLFIRMPLGAEELLPSNCLNINEFRAIHINTHSIAHEYSLEQELSPNFHNFGGDRICLFSIPLFA